MPLTPGTRLGPYEITTPLGAGGMGEVYRARDTRLGRDVAIKVLAQHLSSQPEIRARFEREAKTISSLNHPHICTLFDVGNENGTEFLVMELIEGTTLAERLLRGSLPGPEMLRLATQIADALDRAHRAGVTHRDLKPGNIMITKSGAKLMDFGLSRVTVLAGAAPSGSALSQSPTIAQALTGEGTLLGTFQYMSPEQLEGREADARSDIWALGCVLYEMVTGRRAFEGRSQASLIAAILEREPTPVGEPPSGSSKVGGPPHGIERLIRNCLAKDPDERIQTAHDVRLQLQGIAETAGVSGVSVAASTAGVAAPVARARGGNAALAWCVAALGVVAAIGAVTWAKLKPTPREPAVRMHVDVIPGMIDMFWPRLSPDGRYLMVDGLDSTNVVRAFVRPLDQLDFHEVPGTEAVARAYWSPDGREIAFARDGKLLRVAVAGGSPVTISLVTGADLSWGSKNQILIDGQFTDSLKVIPASGGDPQPATRIYRADGEIGSAWPHFLPDGEHFLFVGNKTTQGSGSIRLGRLGSLDSKVLGSTDGRVEYAPGGWVLYPKGPTLLAQKLDLGAGKLVGQPITLVDQLRFGQARGHFSVSNTGLFAFCRTSAASAVELRERNRAGQIVGPRLAAGPITHPGVSPDGRRILYLRTNGIARTMGDAYVSDLDRGTETRMSFDGQAFAPVWSPDGNRIAYVTRTGHTVIHLAAADGLGGQDSIVVASGWDASLTGWTSDNRLTAYDASRQQCYALSVSDRSGQPVTLGDSTVKTVQGVVSPDGRWLASTVGRGRNTQVIVTSLVGTPGRAQVSTNIGFNPRWSKNGHEILYESAPRPTIVAVDVDTQSGFRAGTPHILFNIPANSVDHETRGWTADAAGERFIVPEPNRDNPVTAIEMVTRFDQLVGAK